MKKLLILIFVFGIASGANATLFLDIEINGADYAGEVLLPGDVFVVKVVQDATDMTGSGGELWLDYVGTNMTWDDTTPTVNYGTGQYYGWNWALNGFEVTGGGSLHVTKIPNLAAGGTPGIGQDMDIITPGVQDYVSTFEMTFEITVTGDFEFMGQWDGTPYSVSETILVGVEPPEPMTIALLGLGVLFLRRRK
jgi:hypothetical protein